jgi:enterochelin esterase-like enzyme
MKNHPAQPGILTRLLLALFLVPACSGGENGGPAGTGGSKGTGASTTSESGGAAAGSGGAPGTGGAPEPGTGGLEAGTGGAGTGGIGAGTGGVGTGTGGVGTGGGGTSGAGAACANPALDALLHEGIGDFVRPAPYNYGPYAQKRDVPHGTVKEFTYDEDQFYPQSPPRGIKVYEPAQYKQGEESFLAVYFDGTASWAYLSNNTDGGTYRTLNVLDNLIAEKLVPPFIVVFIGNDSDSGHRQQELGPTDDKQARFILEGVLPTVEQKYGYKFSKDPMKRSITGESSGGNAAFTVAWNRPDSFHRMQGHSSSFDFGAAARLPDTVRMTAEVKPLRIHLEGSINGNPTMAKALKEKSYVYQWFNSTDSGHGGPGGDTSFPDGLIWLWKGWECL